MIRKDSPIIEYLIVFIILCFCGFATFNRNQIWKNELSLWSDVARKSPAKARPYNNLGQVYISSKTFGQAVPFLKEAVRLNPYFSYAHYNLGIAYQGLKLYDAAIHEYKKALYGTRQPYFANIHNNLGVCYFMKGLTDMAVGEFKEALRINPSFSDARYNLGILEGKKRGDSIVTVPSHHPQSD